MNVLALDTSTSTCSTAFCGDSVRVERLAVLERGHAESLIPMTVEVLGEAGVGFSELDLIAVTVGPGAFTGLRVGLAAARGMALAAGVPCLGVTTLEAIAERVGAAERAGRTILVTVDTKRRDVYAQAFETAGRPLMAPVAIPYRDLPRLVEGHRVVVAGNAASTALAALSAGGIDCIAARSADHPLALTVADIAIRRWRNGDCAPMPPAPLYLRPADVGPPAARRGSA